jgi:Amt family ammonium transporter
MTSGYAALAGALFIGKGLDDGMPKEVNSVPNVLLGTSLLWFGWFGFNAGSALGANALAGQAFVTTNACTGEHAGSAATSKAGLHACASSV